MAERKRSKASTTAVWIIVGLLMFGMVGFGAVGLSGTARSIGKVGDKPVSVNQYYAALQNEANSAQQQAGRRLSPQEMQSIGLDNIALARVVRQRAMDQEATDLGLSMGDERLSTQIQNLGAFTGLNGTFDRVAYDQYLDRNNTTSSEFETRLREENARNILQTAILSGLDAPAAYEDVIVGFLQETRDFSWAKITTEDYSTGVEVPTENDLRKYHTENADQFTLPSSKDITYAWLTPDMIAQTVAATDEDLRAMYDARADEFNQPETRLVERLVFSDEATAQAALQTILDGSATFEDLVANRGLEMDDVDLGDVQKESLGDAAEIVFGATDPGVVGPAPTNLGPALFRINAILDAQIQTFDDVKADLLAEVQTNQATESVSRLVEDIEDLLAGGATLEEVANETDMVLGQTNWYPGVEGGISDYSEFRTAALTITEDDFPELINLSDGGIFAMRMNQAIPAALQPFDDVRASVETAWEADAVQQQLTAQADALAAQVNDDVTLASLGLTEQREEDMVRTDFVEGASLSLISTVFDMEPGDVMVLEDPDGAIIVQLSAIHAADLETEESQALKNILGQRLQQAFQTDVLAAYSQAVQGDVDVTLDQSIVQSLNSQFYGQGHSN